MWETKHLDEREKSKQTFHPPSPSNIRIWIVIEEFFTKNTYLKFSFSPRLFIDVYQKKVFNGTKWYIDLALEEEEVVSILFLE